MSNTDFNEILNNFKTVPNDYGIVPFWFWNDDLNEDHLIFQLLEMKEKGINEFIIHSRRYSSVKYLSETWFEKVGFVLNKAKEMNMSVWIYDEDNWPSGYAGGKVLEDDFECYGKCIIRAENNEEFYKKGKVVFKDDDFTYYQIATEWHPAYSSALYTDLLSEKATLLFIKHTHQEYYNRFGEYFGNVIKGFFIDETGFYNNFDYYFPPLDASSYCWTEDFNNFFIEKKGYDLLYKLRDLWTYNKETLKTRIDYYEVLTQMYIEKFFNPISDFCSEKGVKIIGHLHSEEMLPYHVKTQGDLMKVNAQLSYPGVDRIDINVDKITEKYASSTAHIYNKERCISETFALSGVDLNMQRIKFWSNYQFVRGINMVVPHAFFSSTQGDRKFESPPSLFFQNQYWKYFKKYSDFAGRLSYVLSKGRFNAVAALYYPITSQYEIVKHDDLSEAIKQDRLFIEIGVELSRNQIDYDIVNGVGLLNSCIKENNLKINNTQYSFIIIPNIVNIPLNELAVIKEFAENGGGVVFVGKCDFKCIDEGKEEEFLKLKNSIEESKNFIKLNEYALNKSYTYYFNGGLIDSFAQERGYKTLSLREKDCEIRYMHRTHGNTELFYFVNEGLNEKNIIANIKYTGKIYRLNPYDGEVYDNLKSNQRAGSTDVYLHFYPNGENIILIDKDNLISDRALMGKKYKNKKDEIILDDEWTLSSDSINGNKKIDFWSEYGIPYYSGTISYTYDFSIDLLLEKSYFLDLGKVYHTAEIYLNGKHIDNLIWEPYLCEITDWLNTGLNHLKIIVSNTMGNENAKYDYPSGLIGPVKVFSYENQV